MHETPKILISCGGDEWYGPLWRCPHCDNDEIWEDFAYCQNCGKKLDWKDAEEAWSNDAA